MSKLKTSASLSKRFKVTSSGKLLRHKACRSHLLEKKSQNRKKKLSKVTCTFRCDSQRFLSKIKQ